MMPSGSHGNNNSQDFELNLASIIDCFTVLITFLLASASFLSIGVLDAGVAAAGNTAKTDTPPSVHLTVEVQKDLSLLLKVEKSGKTLSTQTVNTAELEKNLTQVKTQFPELTSLTLSAHNEVKYEDVVRAMDTSRKVIPAVMLGGF